MLRFVGKRLWGGGLTLAALVVLTYFVMRLAPGGPFSKDRKISADVLEQFKASFHLDEPVWMQFGRYVWGLVHLDFGPSLRVRDYPLGDLIAAGLPYSLTIGFRAVVASLVGNALGVARALRQNTATDYLAGTVGVIGIAVPIFVIGPLCQVVFALWLNRVPVSGSDQGWRSLVMPVLVLSLPDIAYISRLTRGPMIEVMRKNYVRTARGKGIGARRRLLAHVLRGAFLPVVAYQGPATAGIITGSILIETVFALPGIGRHFVDAALNRDYPLALGITLLYGGILILFNILTDLVRGWLDPRVRGHG